MKYLFSFLFLILPVCTYSQGETKLSLSVGYNSNSAGDIEASIRHYFNTYVGIGAGIGYYGLHSDCFPIGKASGGHWTTWEIAEKDQNLGRFYFEPSVVLKTPTLFSIGETKCDISVAPGLLLQTPGSLISIVYKNNKGEYENKKIWSGKGRWFFWDAKSMVAVHLSDFSLGLGYTISNLDVYTNYRNLKHQEIDFGKFYPKKKFTHTVFLEVTFDY
jgi:hypothetical protein